MDDPNRVVITYTAQGKPAFRCFVSRTSEGIVFGLMDPRLGDVHLTVMFKEGRIAAHIADRSRDPKYVYTRVVAPDILGRKVERRLRGWKRPYHGNAVAWVMRPNLRRKVIRALSPQATECGVTIPLEMANAQVTLDFGNRRRWRRVRVRDLLSTPDEVAFRIVKGRPFVVRPLDTKFLLQFTDRQVDCLQDLVFGEIAGVQYFEYVRDKLDTPPGAPATDKPIRDGVRRP